ncbi:MAG: hypothetical protein MUE81_00730 [Thermoflexibacter sp.]|jgi:hypothetical protein|nr:hypothetical protein [Thermoflexibacter sp.]
MKQLNPNWLTEGLIDFEYKKYLILAYLQTANSEFEEKRLYPIFADLIFHYQNLLQIKESKKLIYEQFPQQISKADFEKLQIVYQKIVEDDDAMKEIEDIVSFALPRFKEMMQNGKGIYDYIESRLEIIPIGLLPIYSGEGYLFLNEYLVNDTKIYQYQITVFENTHEKYRAVNIQYIESVKKGIGQTYENLKVALVKKYRTFANPATFMVVSHITCPLQESLLPIAKRILVKYVSGSDRIQK